MSSVVYFVRPVGQNGPVKIGCTTLIEDRMGCLQTWSPVVLEVVATMPGSYDIERRLHAMFLPDRLHGEWFNWSPAIGAVIAGVQAGAFDISSLPEPVCINRRPGAVKRGPSPRAERDTALRGDVAAFCAEHSVPESLFGRLAVRDPAFVRQLQHGRCPGRAVSERVREFMAQYAATRRAAA